MADEEVNLTVLGNKALTSSWVNAIFGELAKFSLDNHLSIPTIDRSEKERECLNRSFLSFDIFFGRSMILGAFIHFALYSSHCVQYLTALLDNFLFLLYQIPPLVSTLFLDV